MAQPGTSYAGYLFLVTVAAAVFGTAASSASGSRDDLSMQEKRRVEAVTPACR